MIHYTYHTSIYLDTAMKTWNEYHWQYCAHALNTTVEELRALATKAYEDGEKFLPQPGCDNFDENTGCRGHLVADSLRGTLKHE